MYFFFDRFLSGFLSILLHFGPAWWPKLEPCWALDTIQEAKQNQIAKIARSGTAPRRELNSEGRAGLILGLKIHLKSIKSVKKSTKFLYPFSWILDGFWVGFGLHVYQNNQTKIHLKAR